MAQVRGGWRNAGQSEKAKTHSMTMFTIGTNQRRTHQPLYPAFLMIMMIGTKTIARTMIATMSPGMIDIPLSITVLRCVARPHSKFPHHVLTESVDGALA